MAKPTFKKGDKVRVCNLDPRDSRNWESATFMVYDATIPIYPYQCETSVCIGSFRFCEYRQEPPKAKPPIGLVPKTIRDHDRIKEIVSAMERYVSADVPIPWEWAHELLMLTDQT